MQNIRSSFEKKSFYAAEQEREDVQIKRMDYIDAMEEVDPKNIIVIDESGANLGMTNEYSRAYGGERAKAPKPHFPGKKYSIIGAISTSGIEAMTYIEGAVNGDIFFGFIENILIPNLKPGQYVVLDNVSFHRQPEIAALIKNAGASVVFLPPYSPDLSPIEKMWSKIKEGLKRFKARTAEEFYKALSTMVHSVSSDDCEGWYEECGYNFS
jgi:transposase